MARNWTPEERQKQSELIRARAPWKQSTGPKTEAGKEITSQNAYKHGFRSTDMVEVRALFKALRQRQKDIVKRALIAQSEGLKS